MVPTSAHRQNEGNFDMSGKTIVVLATVIALSTGCAADALAAGGGGNWSGGGGGYGGPAYGGGGPPGAHFGEYGGTDQGASWRDDSHHHRGGAGGTFGPWGSDCPSSTYYGHSGNDECKY
jgi:hypothetical protein